MNTGNIIYTYVDRIVLNRDELGKQFEVVLEDGSAGTHDELFNDIVKDRWEQREPQTTNPVFIQTLYLNV